jgi:hypothetical protein
METENNVPIPVKQKRARRKKKDQRNPAENLIQALNFILPAQKRTGTIEQQYCCIANNWILASNGTIMMATNVQEDLHACPHTHQFLEALNNCSVALSIVQLSEYQIAVNSEPFKGIVDCINANDLTFLHTPLIDTIIVNTKLKESFKILNPLITESEDNALYSNILIQDGSAVSTNGNIIIEIWHGESFNGRRLAINKQCATALIKTDKEIKGIGSSENFISFYFEDNSFLVSKTVDLKYPEYTGIFKNECNPWPIPENFFKALKAIKPFCDYGIVCFNNSRVTNLTDVGNESSYIVEGIPDGMSMDIASILLIEPYVTSIEFDTEQNKLFFFGDNLRGVILGYGQAEENKVESNVPF